MNWMCYWGKIRISIEEKICNQMSMALNTWYNK